MEAKEYPENPVTGLSKQARRQAMLERYRKGWLPSLRSPELLFLISGDPAGFVVAMPGDRDSLTGHPQCTLWDWGGEVAAGMEVLENQARQAGAAYLVVRVYPGQAHPFAELGFAPELTRVLKKVEPQPYEGEFRLRPATPADLLFIANLNSQGVQAYLPAHRGVDPVELAAKNMAHYMTLNLGPGSDLAGFIISEGARPFGYLLVKLGLRMEGTDESAAYVYDLNLKPEYWGRGAGRILGNYTHSQLAPRGCRYMIGDISCDNQRALGMAVQAMGFVPEWVRWGKRL